jgi:hypothetical protein
MSTIEPTGLEPENPTVWPNVAPAPAAPEAPAPAEASPSVADMKAFLAQLVNEAVSAQGQPAPAPAPGPERTTALKSGSLVSVSHEGPKGRITQHGIVVKLLADADGAPGRAQVAWFQGLSGPIDVNDLDDEAF